jgi:pantoate--beta-alanine ligase
LRIVKLALTVFLTGGEVTIFFLLRDVKLNVGLYFKEAMIIFKNSRDLRSYLEHARNKGAALGFVPTMGALHKGHISLIRESRKASDITVCSIFVNPVQFNNIEDFKKYPTTLDKDILLLEESGCDVVFIPSEKEIYPTSTSRTKHFSIGRLEKILEGKFRPGHFQGVCLVMERLLLIVHPDYLFLGQKDYQQCLVLKRLISLVGLRIKLVICPIVREKNGLAMSSRNLRLNDAEKKLASQLHKSLIYLSKNLHKKSFAELKFEITGNLEKKGFKVDYLELAYSKNLKLIETDYTAKNLIILIAAYLDNVRLIDNLLIKD